jgi:hypothetical protein
MVDAERGTELADVFSCVMTTYYILFNISGSDRRSETFQGGIARRLQMSQPAEGQGTEEEGIQVGLKDMDEVCTQLTII